MAMQTPPVQQGQLINAGRSSQILALRPLPGGSTTNTLTFTFSGQFSTFSAVLLYSADDGITWLELTTTYSVAGTYTYLGTVGYLYRIKLITITKGAVNYILSHQNLLDYSEFGVDAFSKALAAFGSSAAGVNASGGVSASGGITVTGADFTAVNLKHYRKGIGKVRAGNGNCKVLIIGHSGVNGSGSTGVSGYGAGGRVKGWVPRLGSLLNSYFIPTIYDSMVGAGARPDWPTFDPRFTIPVGTWTFGNTTNIPGAIGGPPLSSTNGAKLAFAPAATFDNYSVWYPRSGTQGTFTLDVDGGATTPVNANNSTSIAKTDVTVARSTHTINITKTNASSNYILGIRVWDSTTSQVELIQGGHSGATSASFYSNGSPWEGAGMIQAIAPDLTIIDVLNNDWVTDAWNNGVSVAQWQANFTALVTAAQVSGDVILVAGFPSAISQAPAAQQAAYVSALTSLAKSLNVPLLSLFNRFESYEISQPLGLYADTLHPNGDGYGDIANVWFRILTSI